MKRIAIPILTVLIAIGTSRCADGSPISFSPTPEPETCLAGDTVRTQKGEHFEISLYNQGIDGGYYWLFVDEFSDDIIECVEYRIEETHPGLFGSPAYEIWKYDTKGTGKTCATLERKRPWLTDDPPLETKNIVVIID